MKTNEIVKDTLSGMASGPKDLSRELKHHSEDTLSEQDLLDYLQPVPPTDDVFYQFSVKLAGWDYEASAAWVDGTEKSTTARREKIYELLKVSPAMAALLTEKFPPNTGHESPIVIATKHDPWYDAIRQGQRSFYRDSYSKYLREKNGWSVDQVNKLEEATRLVAERLSDPERPDIYPVKGLVVGHVQSGKTSNFTGVIARAADAGYRLIIVLAGTLNILRAQTQRRLDRELVGRPFISAEEEEVYAVDIANFVNHGGFPSEAGGVDWHRLTTIEGDYKRLKLGIQSLEFRKRDKSKPFNHPDNLHFDDVRLLVIKKTPGVLKKVAADLNAIKSRLADIPTLIIDDESDQASPNTRKPTDEEVKDRTATNLAIVNLLQQLPRAQYVGYTATPFANVFVDPNLSEDLFPRDFIISLTRPDNYMGVSDFHDLDRPDKSLPGPNELALVRDVRGEDDEPENLQRALDSYILTGAIKLYRQSVRPELAKRFRHHTMLIHSSVRKDDHATMGAEVNKVLNGGGYTTGAANSRLQDLWDNDFAPVCALRADGQPVPASFAEIEPFLGLCWGKLNSGPKRVLVVNGDANDNPDFESDDVWKIVVGGAKLSRGYTIEGLTISYYRRRTGAADTLMQMGRWFGYRDGYRDLIRLYVGREERIRNEVVDLYEAFEAICRDEIDFRQELQKYANPTSGEPIQPIQVPPLVPSHLLQPTSKNKMYNAFVEFQNFSSEWKEPTLAPSDDKEILKNQALLEKMLKGSGALKRGTLSLTTDGSGAIPSNNIELGAQWVALTTAQMLTFLKGYQWLEGKNVVLAREIEFLESTENTNVDKWLLLCVDGPVKSAEVSLVGEKFRPFNRSRVGSSERFGVYSESDHRTMAAHLAGLPGATSDDAQTEALRDAKQGVFVFYPTRDRRNTAAPITPGFALQFPTNAIPTPIRFGVRVKSKAIVIDTDARIGDDYSGLAKVPSTPAGVSASSTGASYHDSDFDAMVKLMGLKVGERPTYEVNQTQQIALEKLAGLVKSGLVSAEDLKDFETEEGQPVNINWLKEAAQGGDGGGEGMGNGIFDVFGSYFPDSHHVVLYDRAIRLAASKHGWSPDVLSRIVYWHEMAHAANHLGLDDANNIWENFSFASTDDVEYFAQIYAYQMLNKSADKAGAIAKMEELTKTQPAYYGTYLAAIGLALAQLNAALLAARS